MRRTTSFDPAHDGTRLGRKPLLGTLAHHAFDRLHAQAGLVDLAHRSHRDCIDDSYAFRPSGSLGDQRPHEREQVFGARLHAGLEHDEGHGQFARMLIRFSDRGRDLHGAVPHQRFLDLSGIDVMGAANDDVLGTTCDIKLAIGGDVAQVPADQPATVRKSAFVAACVRITGADVGSLNDDDAGFPLGKRALSFDRRPVERHGHDPRVR